mgnify:FL=1
MKPLDPIGRSLLDDARADVPPSGADSRVWQSVSQQLQAPLPPTAASASRALGVETGATLMSAPVLKLAVFVVASATAGVWVSSRNHTPESQPSAAEARVAQTAPSNPPVAPAAVQPETADVQQPPPSDADATSTLAEETRLLAEAQRALGRGDAKQALTLVAQHEKRFPQGQLAQPRDAARVLALCALSRTRAAQRAQRQFLRDWPTSPLKDRVLNACSER